MEKTYLRFVCVEVMERLARCESLLTRLAETSSRGNRNTLSIVQGLQERLSLLETKLLEERELLVGLLTDTGSQPTQDRQALLRLFTLTYQALSQLTQVLTRVERGEVPPELHLFLKDALPEALQHRDTAYTVVLDAEGQTAQQDTELTLAALQLEHVQFAWLSVLQQDNPLAWVGLGEPMLANLAKQTLEANKPDKALSTVLQRVKKEVDKSLDENALQTVLQHSLGLRLLGPAYYFHTVAQALLNNDMALLGTVENTLFYGLNHFNVAHNQTVILHEAAERMLKEQNAKTLALSPALQADCFKIVEKVIPERFAFAAKHLERAIQLKERLAEGILLSSASVFPIGEVAQAYDKAMQAETSANTPFPIYQLLSMTTEYPHTPREIVNAGWLHKVERGAVWAFAALQESPQIARVPYQKLAGLFSAQDHLLAKSIETTELHRVLLYSPEGSRA